MSEHVYDDLAAYALGALDDDERVVAEAHLATCDLCRIELQSLSQTVNALPSALEPVTPPEGMKARLMRRAEEESRRLRKDLVEPTVDTGDSTASTKGRGLPPRFAWITAAVSAAVLVAILAIVLIPRGPSQQAAIVRYQNLVALAVQRGDQVTQLRPQTNRAAGRKLAVAISPSGHAEMIIGPASQAPAHHVYELWFLRDGKDPVKAGVFATGPSSAQTMRVRVSAAGYDQTAVTVEPGPRGTTVPTTKPILFATLS